jgi:ABC-type multidrug transport system fused ATPase/permease subunit
MAEPSVRASLSTRETVVQWRKTIARLGVFGRAHRRWLALGSLAALAVIALRLALPLVFRDLLSSAFGGGAAPSSLTEALPLGGAAVVLATLLGLADHLERLWYPRFASGLARDVRRAAFQGAVRGSGAATTDDARERGEIAFALIGDTARMKTGVRGFLVHVATNLVLTSGVVVVMFVTSPLLGAIFAVTAGLSVAFTFRGAVRVYQASKLARKRESKLAESVHAAIARGTDDARTAKLVEKDASLRVAATAAQGQTTWATHALFGLALCAATLFAADALGRGVLSREGTLTFFLYALSVRAPLVQLSRQGSRAGKILAAGHRVSRVLRGSPDDADRAASSDASGRNGTARVEEVAASDE